MLGSQPCSVLFSCSVSPAPLSGSPRSLGLSSVSVRDRIILWFFVLYSPGKVIEPRNSTLLTGRKSHQTCELDRYWSMHCALVFQMSSVRLCMLCGCVCLVRESPFGRLAAERPSVTLAGVLNHTARVAGRDDVAKIVSTTLRTPIPPLRPVLYPPPSSMPSCTTNRLSVSSVAETPQGAPISFRFRVS